MAKKNGLQTLIWKADLYLYMVMYLRDTTGFEFDNADTAYNQLKNSCPVEAERHIHKILKEHYNVWAARLTGDSGWTVQAFDLENAHAAWLRGDSPTPSFTNHYHHCGQEWEDPDCDSMHNDRCPVCNREITPYKSVENDTGKTIRHGTLKDLKEKGIVDSAKEIFERIKGRDMQVFDVKTQVVHSEFEVKVLRAALRYFVEHKK